MLLLCTSNRPEINDCYQQGKACQLNLVTLDVQWRILTRKIILQLHQAQKEVESFKAESQRSSEKAASLEAQVSAANNKATEVEAQLKDSRMQALEEQSLLKLEIIELQQKVRTA